MKSSTTASTTSTTVRPTTSVTVRLKLEPLHYDYIPAFDLEQGCVMPFRVMHTWRVWEQTKYMG